MKECNMCKKKFKQNRTNQIYCSSKCRWDKKAEKRKGTEYKQKYKYKPHKKNKCSCGNLKTPKSKTCQDCYLKNRNPVTNRKGKDNPNYKGGCIREGRYKLLCRYKEYIFEHRAIIEQHIGRKLKTIEHIHHINGNGLDNRIENLKIMSNREHMKLHNELRKKQKESDMRGNEK